MNRRLSALLVADIVGYSSLMAGDEEGTAARLSDCRQIWDSEIAAVDGRAFKTMGDAVFAEFGSPLNAVRCAVGIRDALTLAERDHRQPLRMRFGLHLADVIVQGEDLIGDGVNLAARIQQAAEPGEINVSAALFEQIRRISPFTFEDRGEQSFRNIAEPVRTYRLSGEVGRNVFQVSPVARAPSRVKRPYSLAVLPIEMAAGQEDTRFLAEGLAEELIFELARFRKLFVTSRSASRALEGSMVDPTSIGDQLGVRYLLSGKLRHIGTRVRLSLSLIDAETGGLVWSDRLNHSLDELVDELDDLVSRIAATALGRIEESDIATTRRMKPESMTAYELYLRGLEYHRLGGVEEVNYRTAVEWFARAIEADPTFARPRAMWVCARTGYPGWDMQDIKDRTQRALELDPNDPEANRIMGAILMYTGEFDSSREFYERAMALSPSDAYIKAKSADFYTNAGEPERALTLLDEAEELDPFLPVWCAEARVSALYALERHEEALVAARALTFQTRRSRLYRAASRVALNDIPRARWIVAEARASAPDLTETFVEEQELFRDRAIKQRLIDRLRVAGLPRSLTAVAHAS